MGKIDLKRFTEEVTALVAISDGSGRAWGRAVKAQVPDGWYWVKFGNSIVIDRPARPAEMAKAFDCDFNKKNGRRVYSLGGEGIPINFANHFEKGEGGSILVNFLNLEPFHVARISLQDDLKWYFIHEDPKFQRSLLNELKSAFEKEESIEKIKGVTPELRYYFLLLTLQRQSFKAAEELENMKLAESEREKRIKEFQATFAGRLQTTIEQADGELLKFYKVNATTYMVHWKVRNSNQVVKSTIKDDMKILSLGFCASGEDRKHWLDGAIQLAKSYGNLYITRD